MSQVIQIEDQSEKDGIIRYIREKIYPPGLTKTDKRNFRRKCNSFIFSAGVLKIREGNVEKEVIIKSEGERKRTIIYHLHNQDHAGVQATYSRVKARYCGIKLEDVKDSVDACINCQRETPPAILQEIRPIVPTYPRERLIVDTVDLSIYMDHNNGLRYIFTMVDSFTKYGWCYPSKRKDGASFARILESHFYKEGVWKLLHSDNGGEFVNDNVSSVLQMFGVESVRGRPYHPQSQGQVERFNRTIKSRLKKSFAFGQFDWGNHVDRILFWYNNNTHRATSLKPAVLFKGYDHDALQMISSSSDEDFNQARIRLMSYVESYRRECMFRDGSRLEINDRVLALKPYRPNIRRRAFEPLYYEEIYIIQAFNGEKIVLIPESGGEPTETSKYFLKKLNN